MELFEIGSNEYYFDIDAISNFVRMEEPQKNLNDIFKDESETDDEDGGEPDVMYGTMIDVTKWEVIKTMVDVLVSDSTIVDERMLNKDLSIPSKLAFNTLIKHNLIKNK